MDPAAATALGWYALSSHPCGASRDSWFEMIGTMVYAAAGNPAGPSTRPWFQIRGGLVYPVDGHPDGPSPEPCFLLLGDFVRPVGEPRRFTDAPPWFRVAPDASALGPE